MPRLTTNRLGSKGIGLRAMLMGLYSAGNEVSEFERLRVPSMKTKIV